MTPIRRISRLVATIADIIAIAVRHPIESTSEASGDEARAAVVVIEAAIHVIRPLSGRVSILQNANALHPTTGQVNQVELVHTKVINIQEKRAAEVNTRKVDGHARVRMIAVHRDDIVEKKT